MSCLSTRDVLLLFNKVLSSVYFQQSMLRRHSYIVNLSLRSLLVDYWYQEYTYPSIQSVGHAGR